MTWPWPVSPAAHSGCVPWSWPSPTGASGAALALWQIAVACPPTSKLVSLHGVSQLSQLSPVT